MCEEDKKRKRKEVEKTRNMKVVIDTDIVIDVLRGFEPTKEMIKKLLEKNELIISGITEAEIFAGKDMEVEEKKKKIVKFLSRFKKINPDNKILQVAGEFRRRYKVSLLDCIIAATAYVHNAGLFTRNKKDFEKIKEIRLV